MSRRQVQCVAKSLCAAIAIPVNTQTARQAAPCVRSARQGHKCRETSARGSASTARAGQVSIPPAPIAACGAGKYANSDKTECTLCDAGKWSDTEGASSESTCTNCPAGTYSAAMGVQAEDGCNDCRETVQ